VSHHSALVLLDLPTYDADLSTVHLTRLNPSPGRPAPRVAARRNGLVLHQPIVDVVPPEVTTVRDPHRAAYVPVEVAVVQAGLTGTPLTTLVAADAALHRGMARAPDLVAAVRSLRGHHGIGPVRAVLAQADGRIESPGETLTGYIVRGMGLELEPQFEVQAEGRQFRADFRIKGTRVLVEFDGRVKYATGDGRVLFEEKQREDALRRAGWVVVRVVWSDLQDPAALRRRVRSALRLAA
jgi:very-short-patch-repair endonuclease